MNEFVWEETPWEKALPDLCDGMAASVFLTLLAGEEEDAVEQALFDLRQKDILLNVENLNTEGMGTKTTRRLELEKGLAEGTVKIRDLEENDPLRLFLLEMDAMPEGAFSDFSGALTEKDRENLAAACLPEVLRIAMEYAGKGVLLMDLIQEGSLGLWQGLTDDYTGELSRHLERSIRRAMTEAITLQARQNGVGARIRKSIEDFRRADALLLNQLGRNPGISEIAEYLGISSDTAEEIKKMMENALIQSREPENISPDADHEVEATEYFQMRQKIADLLDNLEPVDAEIIKARFGLETGKPADDAEIAGKLGITPEEVEIRGRKALEELKKQG